MISERYLRQLKSYCCGDITTIENYEEAINDKTQKWEIHHRLELTKDGKFQYYANELIEKKMYYNRPANELIFLMVSEHRSLHSKARKGSINPMYGKEHSDDTKEKMSKSKKGKKATAEHVAAMKKPYKHHDITVSATDDKKEYNRQYQLKNKDELKAKRRERDRKRKLSSPNK